MRRSLTPPPQLVRRTSVSCQAALPAGPSVTSRSVDPRSTTSSLLPPSPPRTTASSLRPTTSSAAISSGWSCTSSHQALLASISSSSSHGSAAWLSPSPRYQPQLRRPFASSSPPAPAQPPKFYIPSSSSGVKAASKTPLPSKQQPASGDLFFNPAASSSSKQALPADVLRQAGLKVPSKPSSPVPPSHRHSTAQAGGSSASSFTSSKLDVKKPPSDPKILRPNPAAVPALALTSAPAKWSWAAFPDPMLPILTGGSGGSASMPYETPVFRPALTPYMPAPLAPGMPAESSPGAEATGWDRTAATKRNGLGAPKLEFLAPTFFTPGVEQLSQEQKAVHDLVVKDGVSIFYTGSAGASSGPSRAAC